VFVDPGQWIELKNRLLASLISNTTVCGFIFWSKLETRVEHIGAKPSYDPEGTIIA